MKRLIDGSDLAGKLRTRKANAVGHTEAMDAYETAMNDAIDAEEITLNTLRDEVYEDAVAHGLYDEEDNVQGWPVECAAMIECETDELYEAAQEWEDSPADDNEHFIEELADVIIMSLSVAGKLGIDIDAAVRRKIEFNKTRSWKHEGEKHESNPD